MAYKVPHPRAAGTQVKGLYNACDCHDYPEAHIARAFRCMALASLHAQNE